MDFCGDYLHSVHVVTAVRRKWKQQQCCRAWELQVRVGVLAGSLLCPFLQLCIRAPTDPAGFCWQLASFLLPHLPHQCRLPFQEASHRCPWPGPAAYSGKESKFPYYRDIPKICFLKVNLFGEGQPYLQK